ncbi:MAG: zinc ribbon domain-containing protein [Oscillospiraceae bacterium]|nr:zinc ribbon domain-containing protein [Oscillospiraceae bacterium]
MEMKEIQDKLSKLGDDVMSGAESLAKGAFDGSKRVAEFIRLKGVISQAESRLNAAYIEIGKKYDELYGLNGAPEFAELLAQVAESRAQIARAREMMTSAGSAAMVCRGCGEPMLEGQRFCPHCGIKQTADPVE